MRDMGWVEDFRGNDDDTDMDEPLDAEVADAALEDYLRCEELEFELKGY